MLLTKQKLILAQIRYLAQRILTIKKYFTCPLQEERIGFQRLTVGTNAIFIPQLAAAVILSDAFKLPETISFLSFADSWAQVGNATVDPYVINQTYNLTTGGFNGFRC